MKDRDSRAIRVWVVPVKGVGADMAHAVQRAVEGVHELGHRGAVVVKTDNEPSLLALSAAFLPWMSPNHMNSWGLGPWMSPNPINS